MTDSDIKLGEGELGAEVTLIGSWIWGKPVEGSRNRLGISLEEGDLNVGGNGANGSIQLFDQENKIRIDFDSGDETTESTARIHLNGEQGDIWLETIGSLSEKIGELERRIAELEE